METLIYYVEKIYNTIKANGIYIFLSVFFVFLLFVISDVSDDFIYALSEKGNMANVFFIALAFVLLTLSLWVIPAAFLKFFLGRGASLEDILFYYQGFEDIYNGKKNEKRNQIPVKYIAIAPWVMYTVTVGVCLMKSVFEIESVWWIFLGLLFISFYVLSFLNKKFNTLYTYFIKNKSRGRLLDSLILLFIIITVLPLIIFLLSFSALYKDPSGKDGFYNIFLGMLIIYNVFCILGTFLFLLYKEKEPGSMESKYNFSKRLHFSTILISVSLLLIFSIFSLNSKLIWISPTVILIIISTVFILGFELLYTTPRIIIVIEHHKTGKLEGKYDKQRYIFYGVLILFGIILAIQPDKTIYMIKNKEKAQSVFIDSCNDERVTLDGYFLKWLNHNHQYNQLENTEPIDVYLISGEGGGSTAGSWLLSNLLNVEATNPQFYNNLFSISTVSGSSNGANFYFAVKTQNILPVNVKTGFIDERRHTLVSELYATNYFSSNFLGLMFSDYFINPIAASIRNKNIDRNYILQQEEKNAMLAANYAVNSKYLKSVENYFDQNYLDLWYGKKTENQKPLNPLFFINTTLMEKGEKAIFSPVRPDGFSLRARDIVKEFASKDENKGYYIPISAAVAQSQAFPMLSTYNKVTGIGHLGDGGFYENTGTSTTLSVYKRLKKYTEYLSAKVNPKRKIRFILVNFISAPSSKKEEDSFDFLKNSMLRYTIAQTYKTPFNGHAKDAFMALSNEVENNNIQYNKENKDEEGDKFLTIMNSEKFATTRLISQKMINEMFVYRNTNEGAGSIIGALKKANSDRNAVISENNNGASISTVYIRYSNNASTVNSKLIKSLGNYISNEVIITNPKDSQKRYMFSVQGVQNIPSFDINQIRYFHKEDWYLAKMLCEDLGKEGLNLEVQYFNYRNFKDAVPKGQLEIWVDQVPKLSPDKKDVKK
ncbi:hypothetical protein HX126_14120 [Chryseobacterium indologenes]|uniref:hypothetical protein n=1 Tax=Chryseobacterium indologenes TaxID=253 RepID=UPI0025761B65|nr:hypothetical protein [Chryseobacterium indologenes]MDM1555697.1 hypothetical protein [Chryseobacterium indologenes]